MEAASVAEAPQWLLDAPHDAADRVAATLLYDGGDPAIRFLLQALQPALRRLARDLRAAGIDGDDAASVAVTVTLEHLRRGRPAHFAVCAVLVRGIRRDAWRAAGKLREPATQLDQEHAARLPADPTCCATSEVLDLLTHATRSGIVTTGDAKLVGELAFTSRIGDAAARRRCNERTIRRRRDRTYAALRAMETAS
ncbi:MAG TPA: hypothetical protein VHA73_05430 [Acidimicrobiales bacterium]|nr:hypothetical protein [Acidimicrobiales bacterium]